MIQDQNIFGSQRNFLSKVNCVSEASQKTNWNNRPVMEQKRELSRLMRKSTMCICENKDADQLRGNRASVLVQTGLCRTCSETTLLVFSRDGSVFVVVALSLKKAII